MNLDEDLRERWRPSDEQIRLADALLEAGFSEDRGAGERGVYTPHLLLNKEYGFWTASVELVHLDGVFLECHTMLRFVHLMAEERYRATGVKLVGGWTWHSRVGLWAVWEDIMSRFPGD